MIWMSVVGDDIVKNCRRCFSDNGYGIALEKKGEHYVCPVNEKHRYALKNGYMESI